MKRFSKVSFDDIKTIQVDSGVLLKEFDVENPVFLPENVICATSGGINPVCAPEYYDFSEDVDNVKPSKETKRIRGWNATISFTTLTASLTAIKLALGAADISGKVLSLRQRLQYAKDFNDIWWVGKRADDKLIAIRLIRSLSDSGFSLQTTKKGKGQMSVTLKGHSSFSDIKKVPMEIYVFAESDIPVTPDEPVTSEMYLYGTPSTTGNIGLRNGESVTYYDGAVLPNIDTVYTDELQKTHPYAYITVISTQITLWLTDIPIDAIYNKGVLCGIYSNHQEPNAIAHRLSEWNDDYSQKVEPHWIFYKEYTPFRGGFQHSYIPIWANTDMGRYDRCYDDTGNGVWDENGDMVYEFAETVGLYATDPIPVSGAVIYRYDLNDFSGEYDSYAFRSASGNDGLDKDETIAFDVGEFPLTMQETFEYNRKFMSIGSLSADLLHLEGSDYIAQAGNKISVTWMFPEVKWGISQTTAPAWAIHFKGESGAYYSIAEYSESTKETSFIFLDGILKSVIANPVISLIEEGGKVIGFTASGDVIYNIKSLVIHHSSTLDYMTGSGTTAVTYNSVDDFKLTVER